jgi:hypothetical protein
MVVEFEMVVDDWVVDVVCLDQVLESACSLFWSLFNVDGFDGMQVEFEDWSMAAGEEVWEEVGPEGEHGVCCKRRRSSGKEMASTREGAVEKKSISKGRSSGKEKASTRQSRHAMPPLIHQPRSSITWHGLYVYRYILPRYAFYGIRVYLTVMYL